MKSRIVAALVIAFLWLAPSQAGTLNLNVPLFGQEMDNWCWDASSKMVLAYYGFSVTQTAIANYAVDGLNVPNHLSSTVVGPLAIPDSNQTYNRLGCGLVLTHFGPVDSSFLLRCLTEDEVKEEIDGKRPAILLIRWLKKGKDVGGHIIVLHGYDNDGATVLLNDPWPTSNDPCVGCAGVAYIVDYDGMFDPNSPPYSGSGTVGNRWSNTLKTGRALDLCFLIDTTGSMGNDIDNVKSVSLSLINDLVKNYKDLHIAVVDYRDNPDCAECYPSDNSAGDYITHVDTPFTDNNNVARAAINALSLGYGGDEPEAVFSALIRTMSGAGIGAWRESAERRIILMGDAPGHDPEPWDGGYSFADVLAYWAALKNKIAIHALYIGGGGAEAQFTALAADTGGSTRYAAAAGDVGAAMKDLIDDFTETPRSPHGDTKSFMPVFTFTPPTESMGPSVKNILLEIQKSTKSIWKNYKKIMLPPAATSWTPTTPFPQGDYEWRLGYVRPSGVFTLPSGKSRTMPGATLMEPNWTTFTRVEIEPCNPKQLSPASSFTASTTDVNYSFSTAINADKYAMEIYNNQNPKAVWKCWKKLTIKPTAKDVNDAIVEVKVKGHRVGKAYEWRVQSLNYDRPMPDPNAWVGQP